MINSAPTLFNNTDIALVLNSGLFDAEYYKAKTGNVNLSTNDLAASYLKGWFVTETEPGPRFDGKYYQELYRTSQSGMAPLLHYLKFGMNNGFNPWSEKTVLAWQEPFLNSPEFALAELNKCAENWPALDPGDEVQIHVHSKSHIVFHEFQDMLISAFRLLDIDAKASNEVIHGKPRLRIIIAPHDFFYLDPKVDFNSPFVSDCILFNTEQVSSVWFGHSYKFLHRAVGVMDINLQTAVCLSHLGIKALFLPLGRVDGHCLFHEQIPLSAEFTNKDCSIPLSDLHGSKENRPLDLLWIGSNSKRRQAFLDSAQPTFDELKYFIRLVNVRGALSAEHPDAISALSYAALGQRSKILLNIHHFGIPYFEWQRLMHFGFMQAACVVTETASRIPHLTPGEHYLQADLQHIPELVQWLLHDEQGRLKLESVRVKGYQKARRHFDLSVTLKEIFKL